MLELLAGLVVALAAAAAVLEPLVSGPRHAPAGAAEPDFVALEESDSPKIRALLALKEIEFDRATGKLSDEDYAQLKARYAAQALGAIRTEEQAGEGEPLDVAEAAVERAKARAAVECPACGPRPESGATFCSSCGRALTRADAPPRCRACGAELSSDAKFCSHCGGSIAA